MLFYNELEQFFIASQFRRFIACHTDDRTFHLGRRIEYMFVYGEQVFYFVPGLYQDTENAVCLASGTGGNAFGHFFWIIPVQQGIRSL